MSTQPCIVCQSTISSHLFSTWDRHYGIPGKFNIARCTSCGLVRLDPIPTATELAGFYDENYYAYEPLKSNSRLKNFVKQIFKAKIKTHDPLFSQPGEFLDIGCGSGDYLHVMRSRGWKVRGVEPSTFGAEEGRRAGFDIFNGTLDQAKFNTNTFEYVRSNHSFEHMPNPMEVLHEIHRILKPGGKVYIGIPNIDSIPYQIFGKYWWYLGAPVHTYNYTIPTIFTLLERSGFSIQKVYFNSNFASLLGSLQIYVNRNNGKKSADGWLIRNSILRLLCNMAMWAIDLIGRGDAVEVIAQKPTSVALS
ncbi:class I SAM-dependent methyltransferase [Tunturiibacter lichenicola]|uniref:class I SAM-dependent methyltransferase n=1 Tax=Tunturiibacter lichenicola TaxID=2051959 RepID=UPI003D9B4BB5